MNTSWLTGKMPEDSGQEKTEKATDRKRTKAREEGMITLREDGLLKIEKGITTVEEVLRETTVVD